MSHEKNMSIKADDPIETTELDGAVELAEVSLQDGDRHPSEADTSDGTAQAPDAEDGDPSQVASDDLADEQYGDTTEDSSKTEPLQEETSISSEDDLPEYPEHPEYQELPPEPQTRSGRTTSIAWAARTDVGRVRSHNEDSFLAQPPTFAVCDGMGGHAAGEVASSIAVSRIADQTPPHADDTLLGVAVEEANSAVIEAAREGVGRPGMGCTASCVLVENDRAAIAHVGDSRVYLLHNGTLVRLTHDHSYVEELVDAGEITADEARVHPQRSVITRALGSDPDMYADHFTINVSVGDRLIVCSDGLSSMVEDSQIEALAVSTATPEDAVDALVDCALEEGGHDNVTVVVVDVIDDGVIDAHRRERAIRYGTITGIIVALLALIATIGIVVIHNSWFIGANGSTVAVYRGVKADILGHPLYSIVDTTEIRLVDLPQSTQTAIIDGEVIAANEEEAFSIVNDYRAQISEERKQAKKTAEKIKAGEEEKKEAEAKKKADEVKKKADSEQQAAAQEEEPEQEAPVEDEEAVGEAE